MHSEDVLENQFVWHLIRRDNVCDMGPTLAWHGTAPKHETSVVSQWGINSSVMGEPSCGHEQGDQIGPIFAQWATSYFG
jgi:hypothetical protein